MNLRELLWQTRDLLAARGSTTRWKDYQLRRWLQEAQDDLVQRSLKHHPELRLEAAGTTTGGTSDYAFASDYLAFGDAATLNTKPCRIVDVSDELSTVAAASSFGPTTLDPECAVIDNAQIRFYPQPTGATAYTYFYWRRPHDLFQQVCTFEPEEDWTTSDFTRTELHLSGNIRADSEEEGTTYGWKVTASDADTQTSNWQPAANLDLGDDTSDYVECFFHCSATTNITSVALKFEASSGNDFTYTWTTATGDLVTGGQYLRAPKSAFTQTGTGNWASVDKVYVNVVTSGNASGDQIVFDDVRIYRSPEIDVIWHSLLPLYAAAMAMASDEGFRSNQDPANVFLLYEQQIKAKMGG